MKDTPEPQKKTTSDPKRFSTEVFNEYVSLLESNDLIGVAFFIKDRDEVVVLGDMAGCGIAGTGESIYEAIDTLDTIARVRDTEIAKMFGSAVVTIPMEEEELVAKTAAVESLRLELKDRPGVIDVLSTPSSISVVVSGEGAFDGPWEWEGYTVYAQVDV